MAGITLVPSDLETITGESLDEEKFVALDRLVRALIASAYAADLDALQGHASRVVTAVYTSVAIRILSNPTGVSLISAGTAQVSYGGSSAPFELTRDEAARLHGLRSGTRRRPSYVVLGPGPMGVPWRG